MNPLVKYIFIPAFFLWVFYSNGSAQCTGRNTHFVDGEALYYKVFYNWGFIWIDGGKVSLNVNAVDANNLKLLVLCRSNANKDWLFMIRDTVWSVIDKQTFLPVSAYRKSNEGNDWCLHQYHFDYNRAVVSADVADKNKPHKSITIPNAPCVNDLLTACCRVREIDFSTMKPNDYFYTKAIVGDSIITIRMQFGGKVLLHLNDKDQTFACLKVYVQMFKGTMFTAGEGMTIWITDDENKIPVQIEAKIAVGSVKAIIDSNKGQKYPITALIKN